MLAYFDCTNGVAGDMIVASLLDAGASWTEFQEQISALNLEGFSLSLSDVTRAGIGAKYFHVQLADQHHHHHRHLGSIIEIIQSAKLHDRVKARAVKIFTKLAEAEANVHKCDIEKVHFHEVGAVDAIVDIVGASICLELLSVDEIYYSRIAVGSGQVTGSHGILPIPAPATARLLLNNQIEQGGRSGELTTPTGAAILTALGTQKIDLPAMTLRAVGCGAGTQDPKGHPNILRALLSDTTLEGLETDEVAVLTFNVDDMTGEHLGLLSEQLMEKGALDVAKIPAFMKKNRPATMVHVVCTPGKVDELIDFILNQSTTFGVRISRENRFKLCAEFIAVVFPEGKVRIKLGYRGGKVVQINPEYEDCRKIAIRTGMNFRHVYAAAIELARQEIEGQAKLS